MWLIVCQDGDVEADWAAEGLRTRTEEPVVVARAGALIHGATWEHRVGVRPASRVWLADGTLIDAAEVTGVLNRLCWLTADGYAGASERDREYATAELFALGLSWLAAFGPRVLNPPAGSGLAGAWRTVGQWRWLARSAGLPIVAHRSPAPLTAPELPTDLVALALDGQILTEPGRPLPPGLTAGLHELRRSAGLDVLEARFVGSQFSTVSYLPGLRRYGPPAVDALAERLHARGEVLVG